MELSELNIPKRTLTALGKKNITTDNDLLLQLPTRYKDYRKIKTLANAPVKEECAFAGTVQKVLKAVGSGSGKQYIEAVVEEKDTGTVFKVYWYGAGYMFDHIRLMENKSIIVCGKLQFRTDGYVITNPDQFLDDSKFKPGIEPVYRKIGGVSDDMCIRLRKQFLKTVEDPIEKEVLQDTTFPSYKKALTCIHYPKTDLDIINGKRRLLFNDLLYLSMKLQQNAKKTADKGLPMKNASILQEYADILPYTLTDDQKNVIRKFQEKVASGKRSNLLVQGDVGCGKTAAAFACMLLAASNGYQAVLMAPTKVLAKQHYEDLRLIAEHFHIGATLMTSGMKKKERESALNGIVFGNTALIVATSTCLSEEITYRKLALIVTDEEHKFGVAQKEALMERAAEGVHTISLSATPIPRSLASAVYGEDKDICTIKTMPNGRIPIQTCTQKHHDNTLKFLKYVVCPAIENNEDTNIVSVEEIENIYRKYFENTPVRIETITGKTAKKDMEAIIDAYCKNEVHLLISTTVIEVGVNVPNATVMVIEQADRFGLASLHQLRGRVGRSNLKSYCILISQEPENKRLRIMCDTTDGFKIAAEDMKMRGEGNLIGTEQAGFNRFVQEMLSNPKFYEKTKPFAERCLKNNQAQGLKKLFEKDEEENS